MTSTLEHWKLILMSEMFSKVYLLSKSEVMNDLCYKCWYWMFCLVLSLYNYRQTTEFSFSFISNLRISRIIQNNYFLNFLLTNIYISQYIKNLLKIKKILIFSSLNNPAQTFGNIGLIKLNKLSNRERIFINWNYINLNSFKKYFQYIFGFKLSLIW